MARYSPPDPQKITELIRLGLTRGQIAERLGIPPSTASYHIKKVKDEMAKGERR